MNPSQNIILSYYPFYLMVSFLFFNSQCNQSLRAGWVGPTIRTPTIQITAITLNQLKDICRIYHQKRSRSSAIPASEFSKFRVSGFNNSHIFPGNRGSFDCKIFCFDQRWRLHQVSVVTTNAGKTIFRRMEDRNGTKTTPKNAPLIRSCTCN
jgi:hypothetical protein